MGAEMEAVARSYIMKLLICTQAVDQNDPVLSFFVRWIEEFSRHCEHVTVICLREGTHALPKNVTVYSAGKEKNVPRLMRWYRILRYVVKLRAQYQAVFVHMNPEYLVLAGWLWRLWGKKTALWYVHRSVNLKLRIAVLFSQKVFTASPESFRLKSRKVEVVGHGIDTDFFTPGGTVRGSTLLSVGRLSKTKRHDLAIRAAALAGKNLRVAGEGPERHNLEKLARELGVHVEFLGGLTQIQLRNEYRAAALFIHTSETGSLDKVILEALACGLPITTRDPALKHLEREGPQYVRENHSLSTLIPRIVSFYA